MLHAIQLWLMSKFYKKQIKLSTYSLYSIIIGFVIIVIGLLSLSVYAFIKTLGLL
jgi:hypothetical protein